MPRSDEPQTAPPSPPGAVQLLSAPGQQQRQQETAMMMMMTQSRCTAAATASVDDQGHRYGGGEGAGSRDRAPRLVQRSNSVTAVSHRSATVSLNPASWYRQPIRRRRVSDDTNNTSTSAKQPLATGQLVIVAEQNAFEFETRKQKSKTNN